MIVFSKRLCPLELTDFLYAHYKEAEWTLNKCELFYTALGHKGITIRQLV